MNIAFYINEMNFRGVAKSSYEYAVNNQKILKNKSIIFYNLKNFHNVNEVIQKFKKKFKVVGVQSFEGINKFKKKLSIEYLYVQKSGNKDNYVSQEIKTLVHSVYPQKLNQIHGYKYAYVSNWLSNNFSNKKIPVVPLIVVSKKIKKNLKKKLNISKNKLVFGCHGGDSSFDLKFAQTALINIVKKRKDVVFLFLNIKKFCKHPQIKFLKGTADEIYKKKFINTCDAMIYGRSLGESFGLACGEFAVQNKKIISYKFNRHRSHESNIPLKFFIEYNSYKSLFKIIYNYKKKDKHFSYQNKYKNFSSKKVMNIFNKVFLRNKNSIEISIKDYFTNYISFFKMYYLYLRHKIYNHYFDFIESKFIDKIVK
jgi:hypothetical protein